jgi:PAS domain S-box-containing protein
MYSKELNQAVGETILNYHTLIDKHGNYKFFGYAVRNLSGFTNEELEGTNVKDYIHADDIATVFSQLSKIPPDKTDILLPFRFRIKDGSYRWVEASVTNMDGNPHVRGFLVNAKDITDLIEGINKNKLINSSYANFFAKHPFGVIHITMDGTVDMINPKLTEDLGYNLMDINGRPLLSFFLPKYRRKIFHAFHKARQRGHSETFNVQVYTIKEDVLHVNLTIIPVTVDNKTTELYVVVKDISDRVELQENLRKLSIVADKTTNGVVILDRDGNIEWVNNGFTQMNGYSLEEAMGKDIKDLLKSSLPADVRHQMTERLENGFPFSIEILCRKKNGEQYWILVDISPVLDKNGKLERRISIHTDITKRKAAETELKHLADDLYKRNRELYQFGYIVSHNLRKPVANIMGITSLLESEKNDPEMVEACTKNLKTSIENLDDVIKDLSKILSATDGSNGLQKERIDLFELIGNVKTSLKDMINQSGAIIEAVFEPARIVSHKAYLYSVFYNLISNAIKYKSDSPPVIKIMMNADNETAYIVVSDNGLGIDMDKYADEIFKPYRRFNANTDGKGLGLFLVKSHIEALNGKIHINSKPGSGTTFRISLPTVCPKEKGGILHAAVSR